MQLIADSGSTKTDWRLVDDQERIHQLNTQGFNPYFQNSGEIIKILQEELIHQIPAGIDVKNLKIYFYGAGCSSEEKNLILKKALTKVFPGAEVQVNHDLLAAARATCGHKAGMAAILGTGSNSCWYDGKAIVQNIPALGFILGDEGSGAHIGKTFICDYLNKEIPKDIADRFFERTKLAKEDIFESVYRKPFPNRFLAGFSKFVYQNLKEEYMTEMVVKCFNSFFERHICKYPVHQQLKLNVVGSVGFYFSNILRRVASEKGVEIETIIESPISGLTIYHTDSYS